MTLAALKPSLQIIKKKDLYRNLVSKTEYLFVDMFN